MSDEMTESTEAHYDLIGLLLAACDDRVGFDAMLKTLTVGELPALLLATCDIVGSLLMWTDGYAADGRLPEDCTVRALLLALRDAVRTGDVPPSTTD